MTAGTAPRVLVSDFDGTLARDDFYNLFVRRLRPPGAEAVWDDYVHRRINHHEALRRTYAAAAPGEATLLELVAELDLPADLPAVLGRLAAGGWGVVVVSAGCRWYLDRALAAAGADTLERHASPGRVEAGRLVMEWPADTPYPSPDTGVSKAGVVRAHQARGAAVAFAGDGTTDVEAALSVPPELRFAKSALADLLRRRGEGFRPFDRWPEIAAGLLSPGS